MMPEASLAQGLERVAVNHKVAGSIPAGGVFFSLSPFLEKVARLGFGLPGGTVSNRG